MDALRDKKLRFSDVAYAADTTPKSLRNWLQRKLIRLTTFEEGGWREFNLADVAILVLIRQMVDFGVPVDEASDIANVVIIGHGVTYNPEGLRYSEMVKFAGERLILWREAAEWKMRVFTPDSKSADVPDVYASIALAPVVGRAIERALLGSVEDRDSGTDESLKAALEKLLIAIKDATPDQEGKA